MHSRTAWLASYPKSGNTWVRALLSALERGTAPSLRRLDPTDAGDSVSPALNVPLGDLSDTEAAALLRTSWAAPSPAGRSYARRKTHHAWVPAEDGYPIPWQPEGARAVYVVRDPRDVAVSWAHHLGVPIADAVQIMAADVRPQRGPNRTDVLSSWSGHVSSWLHACELPLLLVTYESLIASTGAQLQRMADFLGMPHTPAQIDAAVEACSFTTLAAREITEGFAEAVIPGRAFFRRGEAGSWRAELPSDLAARICHDHGAIMAELGYRVD